ncbi:Piso0_005296 [Millerozyma farinosa CBS 7064]|uniref:glucan endo-1,3-beta-D-glucosidase n=1 Tax=Pichia sorbitophila (strain ATCC MYA-4447 / BCRC 22081 / CBS 7064 / NBRC 10061 / NRRL Y-12695) TaxID=559304 RepID=G8Y4Q7_PICSO|nr:Piso0_005296 [Millerozyma farinosa CBS 7064]
MVASDTTFALFLSLIALSLKSVVGDEVHTVTATRYITNNCFKEQVKTLLSGNEDSVSTGIPIHFVYEDGSNSQSADPAFGSNSQSVDQAFASNSQPANQAFSSGGASSQTLRASTFGNKASNYLGNAVPTTVTPTTSTGAYNGKADPSSVTSSSGNKKFAYPRSTIYSFDIKTVKSAVTTTKTIFKASTTPTTVYEGSTDVVSVTKTGKDPLVTSSVVTKSLSVTIDPSRFTEGISITSSNDNESRSTDGVSVTSSNDNESRSADGVSVTSSNDNESKSTDGVSVTSSNDNESKSTDGVSVTASNDNESSGASSSGIGSLLSSASSIPSQRFSNSSSSSTYISGSNSTKGNSSSLASSASQTYIASKINAANNTVASSTTSAANSSATHPSSSSVQVSYNFNGLSSSTSGSSSSTSGSTSSTSCFSGDLFNAISTDEPPSMFPREELEPVSIPYGVSNGDDPYETNKFYNNLFLGDQTDMVITYPYGMFWKKTDYYGLAVQHYNTSKRVFGYGDTNNADVPSYYINPTNLAEVIFSATSLTSSNNNLSLSDMNVMSVNAKISPDGSDKNYIEFPLVQGMGFVTGIYHGNLTPVLGSLLGILSLSQESSSALNANVSKYRVTFADGVEWLIYTSAPDGTDGFSFSSTTTSVKGSSSVDGLVIQVAVAPSKSDEAAYDSAAGMYVTDVKLDGSVSCKSADYSFKYSTEGESDSGMPIVFALPHHVDSMSSDVNDTMTSIKLSSSTKGNMTAFVTDELKMTETLNTDIQFLPWSQSMKGDLNYSSDALELLAETANSELAVDINATVAALGSNYFSGKVLDKYAYILLVVSEIIKDENVTTSTLDAMKDAFDEFVKNKQYYPLMYDTKFKGVTSTASQSGDTGADYGSALYNDHHFHYGYFVHAAAIVGYVDKKYGGSWAKDNMDWVNSLVRDVANPSTDDNYFPVSRMFDWFGGHSWASGLFASGDGLNEESSSEDYNFAYGMKLWGNVIGDQSMESRGSLMLAIMSRAMNRYFLYKSDNTDEPSNFIPNKVSGIFYENKVAYTTFFGSPSSHPEYVHGIHMLPITPASSLIRIPSYVEQEWEDQVSTFIDNVDSGWLGILKLNQALYDPDSSYSFFSSSDFESTYLDDGQSRTWALAFSGGLSSSA